MCYRLIIRFCVIVSMIFPSLLHGDFPISTAMGMQIYPIVDWDGNNHLVVWQDDREGEMLWKVYGQLVDTLGNLVGSNFSTGIAGCTPALAWGETNYLVVGGMGKIYGGMVSPLGEPVGSSFTISEGAGVGFAVGWDEINYLALWQYNLNIYGQLVNTLGELVGSEIPVSIVANSQQYPAVAWDGANYFIVWEESRDGFWYIYGQMVSPSGDLVGGNFAVSTGIGKYPDVEWGDSNYLVVWEAGSDIYGQIVDTSGALVGSEIAISTEQHSQGSPAVAWDGINYFIVWRDSRNGGRDIYGQMVTPSGELIDTNFSVSTADSQQRYLAVVFNNTNYLVVWDDDRNGNWDIYGTFVTPLRTVTYTFETDPNTNPPKLKIDGTWYETPKNFLWETGSIHEIAAPDQEPYYFDSWSDGGTQTHNITVEFPDKTIIAYFSHVGIEETDDSLPITDRQLEVYPNPFIHYCVITFYGNDLLQIYDITGRLVKMTRNNTIGESLKPGIYFLKAEGYKPVKIIKLR